MLISVKRLGNDLNCFLYRKI